MSKIEVGGYGTEYGSNGDGNGYSGYRVYGQPIGDGVGSGEDCLENGDGTGYGLDTHYADSGGGNGCPEGAASGDGLGKKYTQPSDF